MSQYSSPSPPPGMPPTPVQVLGYSSQSDVAAWVWLVRLMAAIVIITGAARVVGGACRLGIYAAFGESSSWAVTLLPPLSFAIANAMWTVGAIGCYVRAPWGRKMAVTVGWILVGLTGMEAAISVVLVLPRSFGQSGPTQLWYMLLAQGALSFTGMISGAAFPALVSLVLSRPSARAVFEVR